MLQLLLYPSWQDVLLVAWCDGESHAKKAALKELDANFPLLTAIDMATSLEPFSITGN